MDIIDNQHYISIAKNVFILYLVISSNFLANLFGCKVQKAFQENMLLKHLLGFLTLYFFITLADTSGTLPKGLGMKFLIAFVVYIWFLFTTRVNFKFWIPVTLMLGTVYILELNKQEEKNQPTPNLDQIEKYSNSQMILIGLSIVFTLVGFIVYLGEKKAEYGSSFQYSTFLFGTTNCRMDKDTSSLSTSEALRKAFS